MGSEDQAATAISIPKGGGALHGIGETFSPDLFTGTGNFTVPLALPDGRNGFQPKLSLSYSTGHGNGAFGLGWALSVPGVSRKTSRGLPLYEDSDTFLLSGAEDLVKVSTDGPRTTYQPRTEGLFARIERIRDPATHHDYWEVATKDGLVSSYGTRGAAGSDPGVIAHPERPTQAFAWRLTETTDPFGNRIVYDYQRDRAREGPHHWDQLYLKRVRYVDFENAGTTEFLVSVEFYYDFERTDPVLALATPAVRARDDPFSEYRSTFEIRTRHRCALIVVRAHPAGMTPVPMRAYRLVYLDERSDLSNRDALIPRNAASLLSRIEVIGYDDAGNEAQELPPLDFSYAVFEPAGRRFQPVPGSGSEIPSVATPNLELVDLHGCGLPDIMEMAGGVRYWRNLGNGRFAQPRKMQEAPAGFALTDTGVALIDANGDGRTDVLIQRPELSASFALEFGPAWKRRPALPAQVPSFDFQDPEVKLIDLDGDGVTDAVRAGTRFDCFFNDPGLGWQRVRSVDRRPLDDFPDVTFSDPRVRVADMSGDGLQDITLIHSGSIRYWPNLGRGDWGRSIVMHASPTFPWGYDPRRVLLGDLDGDGLADLIYVDSDRVSVWFNQGGNGWSPIPLEIRGTPQITDLDSLRVVDLYGNGTSGILFSAATDRAGRPMMHFLDLTGGVKPYLLTEMDNNLGATTRVRYVPSTRFYLEDEKIPDLRWRTPLPFPVQTVASVKVIDQLSGGKLTTDYRYHHGYWDGAEREFRGFGMVEQFDTETFADYHAPGLHGQHGSFTAVPKKYFSQPTLTRSWFHQGPVGEESGDWSERDCSAEFWSGDPQLLNHGRATDAFIKGLPTRRIRRDALRALRGSVLRTELYGLDGSRYEHRPYTVTESAYGLRAESPPPATDRDRRQIFFSFPTAQRTTQWERGDDPLSVFSFTADLDDFGQPRQQTSVAMPRRSAKRRAVEGAVVGVVQPDETRVLATHTLTHRATPDATLAGVPGGRYIRDRVWHTHGFEAATAPALTETNPNDVSHVLRDQYALAVQLHDGYVASLRAWVPGASSPAGLSLVSHTINHFDGPRFAGRDDGKVVYGALTRSEALVFTADALNTAYVDGATSRRPAYLEGTSGLPLGAPAGFGSALGYQRRANAPYQNGWYIDTARKAHDFQMTGPAPAGWSAWPSRGQAIATQDALGHETTIALDRHWLLPVTVTDPAGLQVAAQYNVRVLQADAITDPNGNTTRVRFTPHGLPAKSWLESKPDANNNRSGGSEAKPEFSWTYDFLAYQRSRASAFPQPVSVRTRQRLTHASDGLSDDTIDAAEYSNGFGRVLQKRARAEDRVFGTAGDDVGLSAQAGSQPTAAVARIAPNRVVVSGWQIFDNKGQVVEIYEPFFDSGWEYQPEQEAKHGPHVEMYYDARGQLIRTVNADGSQQRVIYGRPSSLTSLTFQRSDTEATPAGFEPSPWETYTHSPNDLAAVSVDDQGLSLSARAPASHYFTPDSVWVNALGRVICQVERNGSVPAADWRITRSTYDIRGNLTTLTDALGRPVFHYAFDLLNRSLRVASIDGGLRTSVLDALDNLVEYRDDKGAITLRTHDALNRPADVWAANDGAASRVTLRERILYGDGGSLAQAPADRDAARLNDSLGKPVAHWDEAGLLRLIRYDFKGNMLAKTRQVVADSVLAALPANQAWIADWSQPNIATLDSVEYRTDVTFDALNRPVTVTYPRDVSGGRRVLRPRYNRAGSLEAVALFASAAATAGDDYVAFIGYNARGQRTLVEYGNGLMTRYAYDPQTLRLVRLRTERLAVPRVANEWRGQGAPVQDCTYAYDLAGNMVSIDERVPGCGVNNSAEGRDRLLRVFEYDAVNRLTSATGRACLGQTSALQDLPNCASYNSPYVPAAPAPNQDNAPMATERYRQTFAYDPVGNMIELAYDALRSAGAARLWVRRFGLGGLTPQQWRNAPNNRLTRLEVDGTTYTYAFNANGNLARQNLDTVHVWDHADRLIGYRVGAGPTSVNARYLHGADGVRAKKWVRNGPNSKSTVYVDEGFEHHRSPEIPTTGENNTFHIIDNRSRIALIRVGVAHADDASPPIAYSLADHLGSAAVVVGNGGAWINRQEFFPYGETAVGSFAKKRYQYTGMERDEESGLSYHGSRFYAPWLARWTAPDPLGPRDGLNGYLYVRGSPLIGVDPTGTDTVGADQDHQAVDGAASSGRTPLQSSRDPFASIPDLTANLVYSKAPEAARKREIDEQLASEGYRIDATSGAYWKELIFRLNGTRVSETADGAQFFMVRGGYEGFLAKGLARGDANKAKWDSRSGGTTDVNDVLVTFDPKGEVLGVFQLAVPNYYPRTSKMVDGDWDGRPVFAEYNNRYRYMGLSVLDAGKLPEFDPKIGKYDYWIDIHHSSATLGCIEVAGSATKNTRDFDAFVGKLARTVGTRQSQSFLGVQRAYFDLGRSDSRSPNASFDVRKNFVGRMSVVSVGNK